MSVSANTLFHFTSFEAVQGILQSKGFWPQYSLEVLERLIPDDSPYVKSYVPLVSFCDLKLLQILNTHDSKHTHHFGKCGIGLSKQWGIEKRVSPVLYVHHNSVASRAISEVMHEVRKIYKRREEPKLAEAVLEQIKFLKAYEGYWQKGSRKRSKIKYYDEREWRYVPRENDFPAIAANAERALFIDDSNERLKEHSLTFETEDVKFIVLENDEQKAKLSEKIRNEFVHLDPNQKNDLITKILTIKELRQDY